MKTFLVKVLSIFGLLTFALPVFAQGMMGNTYLSSTLPVDSVLQQEESQGASIWQLMQRQELTCPSVTDVQFELLGEYFMGQMMGQSHAAMNARLKASLGEVGEIQTHVTLGKRLSGCYPDAVYSNEYLGFVPMMGMMFQNGEGWKGTYAYRSPMMQNLYAFYGSHGWDGWVIVCLIWLIIISLVLVFVNWVMSLSVGHPGHNAAEHLKIRYAKGEIDKKHFDRLKKELK